MTESRPETATASEPLPERPFLSRILEHQVYTLLLEQVLLRHAAKVRPSEVEILRQYMEAKQTNQTDSV